MAETGLLPIFGVAVQSADGTQVKELEYPVETGIISSETSGTMRKILETVVSEGSGKNAAIEGYSIGRKNSHLTDSSQKCKPLYFFLSGICSGRGTKGTGSLYYP